MTTAKAWAAGIISSISGILLVITQVIALTDTQTKWITVALASLNIVATTFGVYQVRNVAKPSHAAP